MNKARTTCTNNITKSTMTLTMRIKINRNVDLITFTAVVAVNKNTNNCNNTNNSNNSNNGMKLIRDRIKHLMEFHVIHWE